MMMLLGLTFELCRHVSKVVLKQEFWQLSPPVCWVGSSCTFLSSTAHTNLFTVQSNTISVYEKWTCIGCSSILSLVQIFYFSLFFSHSMDSCHLSSGILPYLLCFYTVVIYSSSAIFLWIMCEIFHHCQQLALPKQLSYCATFNCPLFLPIILSLIVIFLWGY